MLSRCIELQRKLTENQEYRNSNSSNSNYKARTAGVSVQARQLQEQKQQERRQIERNRNYAIELLQLGDSPEQISSYMKIPVSEVLSAQEYMVKRNRYLLTGDPRYL